MIANETVISLYDQYSSELFSYIIKLTPTREIAEDILHDVFVNLMEYSHKNNLDMSTIRAFLYKIARNLSINNYKKSSKLKSVPLDDSMFLYSDTDIEGDIINREIIKTLNRAFLKLDPLTRSILVMKKELSMTLDEIAIYHDISKKTVQRKLENAVSVLRNDMKKAGYFSLIIIILTMMLPYFVILNRDGR